jgi:adenosylmethionine-8-amino-7-oxononanoate aminotransferase
MTQRLLITGTDTGVGKTRVTAALAARLRAEGRTVAVAKPFLTGTSEFNGDPWADDARVLVAATGLPLEPDDICAYRMAAPLSPLAAAEREGLELSLPAVTSLLDRLASGADTLLIEGVGGLLVPLWPGFTVADLARALDVPVLLVARAGLGTLNHTLLSIDSARARSLAVCGFVMSLSHDWERDAGEANARIIQQESGVAFAGFLQPVSLPPSTAWREAASGIDVDAVLGASPRRRPHNTATLWHPFTQMQEWLQEDQLTISAAYGCTLVDAQGRRYVDGVSSLWCNVHGHRHPRITGAIHRQLNRVAHSTLLGLSHEPAEDLARALVDVTPAGLEHVFFSDSGATAVEVALRIALEYHERCGRPHRTKFVSLSSAYHGDTVGSVSLGWSETFHRALDPVLFPVFKFDPPHLLMRRDGLDAEAALAASLGQLGSLLAVEGHEVAACILEPRVQGAAGIWIQPQGYVDAVSAICRRHGVLLICDEVATGFGRTGAMFACDSDGTEPDIMTLGKGLSGGYLPLAATLVRPVIFEAFLGPAHESRAFYYGHTFTGNPLGCAAALASLESFREENTLARGRDAAAMLEARLQRLRHHPNVGEVRGLGLMWAIDLVADARTGEPFPEEARMGHRVCRAARDHGVILRPLGDSVIVMPPLVISAAEIDAIGDALEAAIEEVATTARSVPFLLH